MHPVVILILGLALAQAIAAFQVHRSNLDLLNTLTAVSSAGYLAIPGKHVMGSLSDFGPAFWGGFFFTFSIGAGVTLGAMAAGWLWIRLFRHQKTGLFFWGFVWAALLFMINSNGFTLMPTLYFVIIAPVIFALTALWDPSPFRTKNRFKDWIHLAPLPLLALLWFTQFDGAMFLDLRDNLLLSNDYGRKFSNFYYTYTLYPAQAFKALSQKTIKTADIENVPSRSLKHLIGRQLLANDYLPLSDDARVDLVVRQNNDQLVFQADGRRVFQTPTRQFLDDAPGVLRRFSEACDRHAIFRQFTFLSLLIGFPIALYMIAHAALYYPGYFIMGRRTSALTASISCLLIGCLVLIYFQSNRSRSIDSRNIANSLSSEYWQTRIAALKLITKKKLDIADYKSYPVLKDNRPSQERYWLVGALAYSRRPENMAVVLEYLKDADLNVRTMALYSLGRLGNPRAVQPILSIVLNSQSWYEQMYAYKAIRSLGWKQTKSH